MKTKISLAIFRRYIQNFSLLIYFLVVCVQRKQLRTPLYKTHLVCRKNNTSHLTKSARPCRLSFKVLFCFFASLCYDLGCPRHSSSASNAATSGELAFFSCFSSISPCLWGRASAFSRGPVTSLYKQPLPVAIRCKQTHHQETSVQWRKFTFPVFGFFNQVGWSRWCFVVDMTP